MERAEAIEQHRKTNIVRNVSSTYNLDSETYISEDMLHNDTSYVYGKKIKDFRHITGVHECLT